MIAWILLGLAIATEVVGTLALRASDGMSRLVPAIIVVVGYVASFGFLAVVLKTLPVGIVYAIWSAVGVALVAVLGKVMFGDPVPPLAMVGIVLIVGGVVLVSVSGAPTH
jgi:small multidrug resistance pump